MRVAFNCLQVDPSYAGGVNTYTLGLLDGFAALRDGFRLRLYVTSANQHLFQKFRVHKHFDIVTIEDRRLSVPANLCRAALLSFSQGLYRRTSNLLYGEIQQEMDRHSDLVYTPTVVLQWFGSRNPTVLSMHDIQHLHFPEFFNWQRRLSRKITYGLSAHCASYFQASSQFIKHDLLAHFPDITEEQIEVIPEGVNAAEFAPRGEGCEPLQAYGLPSRFLFCPAQLWPHKNHITILRALKKIETRHGLRIPLVLTGARYSAASQIFDFLDRESMGYVQYLGKVPFSSLVALYQQAAFLVTAVLYESSSLPILEAAAAGTPILASRTPPNEEAARVLELNLFDPLDADALARLILALWNDERTAASQSARNRQQVGFYSWENTARKYLQLFGRIVRA